jgi:hypothetical protein
MFRMPVAPIVLARLGSAKDRSVTSNGLSFGTQACEKPCWPCHCPNLAVVYRGQADDVFRPDLRWPVTLANAYVPTERNPHSPPALTLHTGLERRILWWCLSRQVAGTQTAVAVHLESEIGRYVRDFYH